MRSKPGSTRTVLLAALAALCSGLIACNAQPSEQRRQLAAFGTVVTLVTYGVDAKTTDTALAALEERYRELGRDWYPWSNGELFRINKAIAEQRTINVSPELASMLQRAAELEQLSNGHFNAGLGALTELWGFHQPDAKNWRPPDASQVAALLDIEPGAARLQWSDGQLSSPAVFMLDPGGIAKGAILQVSRRILREHGIDNAIIDLGGDLLVAGRANGRDVRIGIRRPGQTDAIAWIEASGGEAVMTSGNYERYFEFDGRRYAHVIDPASGFPARGVASTTVLHRDPLLADAGATALLVAGADNFEALCEQLGIDYALLVTTSGDLRLTAPMRSRVNWL